MFDVTATALCWIGLGTLRVRWISVNCRLPWLASLWLSLSCRLFRCASRIAPDHRMALRYLPWCLVEMGEPARAIEYYQRLLTRHPSFAEGRLELGEALNALGRHSEAVGHLERALVESPQDARVERALAIALLVLNHPQDALPLCRRLVEHDAGDADAWGLLAQALARTYAWEDAIRAYERAHALGHPSIAPHYGCALAELDRFEEAERLLRGAIARHDGDQELRLQLAYALSEQDRHDEAERILRDILREDPENWHGRHGLATFLASRGRSDEAMPIAEALMADAPDEAGSYETLGWVALKAGRFQDALAAFDTALRLAPGASVILAGRATALRCLGRQSEAQAAVRAVVERDPTFFDRHREWSNVSPAAPTG